MNSHQWTHTWRWKNFVSDRYGMRCRITARGKNGNIRVLFEDGYQVITLRYALLKIRSSESEGGVA